MSSQHFDVVSSDDAWTDVDSNRPTPGPEFDLVSSRRSSLPDSFDAVSSHADVVESGARTPNTVASSWDNMVSFVRPTPLGRGSINAPRTLTLRVDRAALLERLHLRRLLASGSGFANHNALIPRQNQTSAMVTHTASFYAAGAARGQGFAPRRLTAVPRRVEAPVHTQHHRMERNPVSRHVQKQNNQLTHALARQVAPQRLTRKQQAVAAHKVERKQHRQQQKTMRNNRVRAAAGPEATAAQSHLANMQRKVHERKKRESKRTVKRNTTVA